MNVKAQGLLNGAAYIRQRFGEEALERVLGACAPEVRDRCTTAIAINWHPREELEQFLRESDRLLGDGDGKLAEAIGAASARTNLRHMGLRLAFFLARPEFLMRRVAGVWRQYNDQGEMRVHSFEAGAMTAELIGVRDAGPAICSSITGWLNEAGQATGMRELQTAHVECKARGASRCLWQLRWSGGRAAP